MKNYEFETGMYKSEKFELRKPEEIIQDINVMHDIFLQLKELSLKQGQKGNVMGNTAVVIGAIVLVKQRPEIIKWT